MTNNQFFSFLEAVLRLIPPKERATAIVTAQFHCHLLSKGGLCLPLSSKGAGRSTLKLLNCEYTSS